MTYASSVVIVEDDRELAKGIIEIVQDSGLSPVYCRLLHQAKEKIDELAKANRLAAVICDLKMPGERFEYFGGWEAVLYARETSPGCPIAIYSGEYSEFHRVVADTTSMPEFKAFSKPLDRPLLVSWIFDIAADCRGATTPVLANPEVKALYDDLTPIYAPSNLPILITGEPGTGKESFAKWIHIRSNHKDGPFVAVNCGALDESLVLAELFGNERGAWTDAVTHKLGLVLYASGYEGDLSQSTKEASFDQWLRQSNTLIDPDERSDAYRLEEPVAGTLFLDEVTCLPQKAMSALLRMLSAAEVRPNGYSGPPFRSYCRIIAATNDTVTLAGKSDDTDTFRRDLFHRLGGVILNLPPVHESQVIYKFVTSPETWKSIGLELTAVTHPALGRLYDLYQKENESVLGKVYQEGNFRTLRNLLHRAALVAASRGSLEISLEHVDLAIVHGFVELPAVRGEKTDFGKIPPADVIQLKRVFIEAVRRHGVHSREDLSFQALRQLANEQPLVVADAFLQCCLSPRGTPDDDRPYYSLEEVEEALTSGASRRAWLSKGLTKEMVSAAATEFYDIPLGATPPTNTSISDVVKLLRSLGGKRKPARRQLK